MEVTKTDIKYIVAYLNDAARLLGDSKVPHIANKARLMRNLSIKLTKRYPIKTTSK